MSAEWRGRPVAPQALRLLPCVTSRRTGLGRGCNTLDYCTRVSLPIFPYGSLALLPVRVRVCPPASHFIFISKADVEGGRKRVRSSFGSGSGGRGRRRHLSAQSGVAKAGHSVQQDWRSIVTLRSSSIISIRISRTHRRRQIGLIRGP